MVKVRRTCCSKRMADPQARRNRMTAADDIRTLAATKSWGRGRIYDSITETIGHTPLVRLKSCAGARPRRKSS